MWNSSLLSVIDLPFHSICKLDLSRSVEEQGYSARLNELLMRRLALHWKLDTCN